MKVRLTMKTPDVVTDCVRDFPDMSIYEKEALEDQLSKWLRYGELLTVEFDTETNTMVVIKPGERY